MAADRDRMQEFHHRARGCFLVMLESAQFIMRELPNVPMSEPHRERTRRLCEKLIGTAHDVSHELSELADLAGDGSSDVDAMASRVTHILTWTYEDLSELHDLVMALQAAAEGEPMCGSAYILVAEPATNLLQAFGAVADAAEALDPDDG